MGNSVKTIGFMGLDCYDTILYSAFTLNNIGNSVLLIDNSKSKSLALCFPTYDGTKDTIYNYRGIDLICNMNMNKAISNKYDIVLIYLGYYLESPNIAWFDTVYVCTDMQKHNYLALEKLKLGEDMLTRLIIRDFTNGRISKQFIQNELVNLNVPLQSCFTLDYDTMDFSYRLACQHDTIIKYNKISASHVDLIEAICIDCLGDVSIRRAIKETSKGR